jgi:hypothetical protein
MQSNPAARCQHIRTSGTQCGSPALRSEKFCYYHQENRPTSVKCYMVGETHSTGSFVLPVFEDAYSIQAVIRQVSQFVLERRIDHKTAGLLLYALQIASSNLKHMSEEKPQPAQVVVDLDRVAETPLETELNANAQASEAKSQSANQKPRNKKKDKNEPSEEEIQRQLDYLLMLGRHLDDPAGSVPELNRLRELAEGKAEAEDNSDDGLPPGTIQACERGSRYVI